MHEINRQTIRDEIINCLKTQPDTNLANIVGCLERKFGIQVRHSEQLSKVVMEEVHLLLLNNILMVGRTVGQWELPWLCVTEYGKKCLNEGEIVSLDPDGYMVAIQKDLPDIDPLILEYLRESIQAFHRGLALASTITLGVASEQTMLLLIESFASFSQHFSQLSKIKDKLENEYSIFKKYKIFKEALAQLPKEHKKDFPQNYDVHIDTLFNLIRLNRNETGHPSGGGRDRNIQAASLQAFKSYLRDICDLMECFKNERGEHGAG